MKKIALALLSISVLLFQAPSLFADDSLKSFYSPMPYAASRYIFENQADYCNKTLIFHPTYSLNSCGGWHIYAIDDGYYPPTDARLRRLLQDLAAGADVPEAIAGETVFCFIGGQMSTNTFEAMQLLFDFMRVKNDGVYDRDESDDTWTTSIPIYDRADCSNPNKCIKIWGFATVVVSIVMGPSEKEVRGRVECDVITEGDSGGAPPPTNIGTIPLLVW